jgi:hypothetical protein
MLPARKLLLSWYQRSRVPLTPPQSRHTFATPDQHFEHLADDPWRTGGANSPNHNQEAGETLISLLI